MATRLEIVTMALQKVNMESSSFVTAAAPLFVQEAYREVYNMLATRGMHMIEVDQVLTLSSLITLPTDFHSVLNLFRSEGIRRIALRRLQPDDEGGGRGLTGNNGLYYKIRRTATNARTLQLYPVPTSGTYTLHYVPVCPTLSVDGTVLVTVGDSDALVACLLAKKFAGRESEAYKELDEEFMRLVGAVDKAAEEVEMTQPTTVQDVRGRAELDSFRYNIYRGDYDL